MSTKEILEQALQLKPEERFIVIETLLKSLDEPDEKIDEIWALEAEKRLNAYRAGRSSSQNMQGKNLKKQYITMSLNIRAWARDSKKR